MVIVATQKAVYTHTADPSVLISVWRLFMYVPCLCTYLSTKELVIHKYQNYFVLIHMIEFYNIDVFYIYRLSNNIKTNQKGPFLHF